MDTIFIALIFLYLLTYYIHYLTYSEESFDKNEWYDEFEEDYLKKIYIEKYTRKGFSENEVTDKVEKKLLKVNKEAHSSKYFHKIFYIIFTIFVLFITYIIITET